MRRAILAVILLLLVACARFRTQSPEPLLANGDFEGGWHRDNIFWTPDGGPHDYYEFGEVAPPEGWTAWWREGFLCAGTSDWRTGRPEVRVIIAIPDAERVRGGGQAVQWFTFWRCHEGGLLQRVEVEPGRYYDFSIFAHSWFANCDRKPHYPLPLDYDCDEDEPILWAQDWLSVGIDPTGGIDPMAPTVIWGIAQEIYGVYGDRLTTGRVQAQEDEITVFVKSEASHPLKHCDFYLDDALLRDVTYQIFLPLVRSDVNG